MCDEKFIMKTPELKPPRKIYWKVNDLFIREFRWPKKLLKYPKEELNFKLKYNQTFKENLKRLKKTYNLTDEECKDLEGRYLLHFLTEKLEKSNYENKKLLDEIYGIEFKKESLPLFFEAIEYIIKSLEEINNNFDTKNFFQQRILMNILLGICFEYTCKALLLSKGYIINKYEVGNEPIQTKELKVKIIKSRTISLNNAWTFLKKKKLIKLTKKEITIGNYLNYLRNMQSHTPILMASKGTYNKQAIELIKKIKNRAINQKIQRYPY